MRTLERASGPEAAFVVSLRRERARLLARQQPARRAGSLLLHGRRLRALNAEVSCSTRRERGEPLLDSPSRAPRRSCAADPTSTPRPPLRVRLRLRRLPRLRAEGRVRLRVTSQLRAPRRRLHPQRPPDRLRPRRSNATYLLCLHSRRGRGGGRGLAAPRPQSTLEPPRRLARRGSLAGPSPLLSAEAPPTRPVRSARSRDQYLDDIETCLEHLRDGDSYEICLTNQVQLRARRRPARPLPEPSAAPTRPRSPPTCASATSPSSAPPPSASSASAATARPKRARSRAPAAAARPPAEDEAPRRRPRRRREEPGREPDDRRPPAQRPRRRLRGRQRRGAGDDGGRDLRDRAPARLLGARPPAPRRQRRRRDPRLLPARLDDRRAEAAHDRDPRRARGRRPRRLLRARSAGSASAAAPTSRSRSAPSSSPAAAPRSGPAARSSSTPIPSASTRRCC